MKVKLNKNHIFIILSVVFIAIIFAIGSVFFILYLSNSKLSSGESKIVVIKKGMNVKEIAKLLHSEGVINHSGKFVFAAKILGISNELKAGRYQFAKEKSNTDFLNKLKEGKVSSIKTTIPEGLQTKQIISILAKNLNVDSLKLMSVIHDSLFVRSFNIPALSLDGFIFPETYQFFWEQDEKEIVGRLVAHFWELINDTLITNIQEKGFTLLEIVTLASLIQGEAIDIDEMPIISGVYHNRLQKNMLLQADPTLQFIISDGPRRLTNTDKKIDSPYNTYLYPGLPPGPINNPGLDAIVAAINPANVPYLYFVANGNGGHTFSRNLEEHLRAKSQFDKIRREHYRKRKSNGIEELKQRKKK